MFRKNPQSESDHVSSPPPLPHWFRPTQSLWQMVATVITSLPTSVLVLGESVLVIVHKVIGLKQSQAM